MSKEELYKYRRQNHLCVNCGERADGNKSRCIRCAQIETVKAHIRREEKIKMYGDDYRRAKNEYMKKWKKKNPEKVAVYKSRKGEYNRNYKKGYCL